MTTPDDLTGLAARLRLGQAGNDEFGEDMIRAAALIERQAGMLEEARGITTDLADELEAELSGRYAGMLDHPAMKRRYDRDMGTVLRARATLAKLNASATTPGTEG